MVSKYNHESIDACMSTSPSVFRPLQPLPAVGIADYWFPHGIAYVVVLRAYPKSSAARKVIQAQAKWTSARECSTCFSHRMSHRRKRFIQACVRSMCQPQCCHPDICRHGGTAFLISSDKFRLCSSGVQQLAKRVARRATPRRRRRAARA